MDAQEVHTLHTYVSTDFLILQFCAFSDSLVVRRNDRTEDKLPMTGRSTNTTRHLRCLEQSIHVAVCRIDLVKHAESRVAELTSIRKRRTMAGT